MKRAIEDRYQGQGQSDEQSNCTPPVSIALLGCGRVGGALLEVFSGGSHRLDVKLIAVSDSRKMHLEPRGIAPERVKEQLAADGEACDLDTLADFLLERVVGTPIIVDATPSYRVAAKHAEWMARGLNVVTANRLAAATGAPYAFANGVFYGDAATVGAGLPVLSALRHLRAEGDRVSTVRAVLSASLGFVFHAMGEGTSFSHALRSAYSAGLTERDPRIDLWGMNIERKLAIMALVMGRGVVAQIHIESLLPDSFALYHGAQFWYALRELDGQWQARVERARAEGKVLRYLATIEDGRDPCIHTVAVEPNDPIASAAGNENVFVIHSDAYETNPLVIRGPGVGARQAASALLDDVVKAATCHA